MLKSKPENTKEKRPPLCLKQRKVINIVLSNGSRQRLAALLSGAAIALGTGAFINGEGRYTNMPRAAEVQKKYSYDVDGFHVVSNIVSLADFQKAYDHAKKIIGNIYWKPNAPLDVEYGNLAMTDFAHSEVLQMPGSQVSGTSLDCLKIVTAPEHLSHELAHFLLGPLAKQWPYILQEIVASAVDDDNNICCNDDELDAPWIQMPIEESMYSGSPLTGFRYAAIKSIAKQQRDKMPEIVQHTMNTANLSFSDLGQFLQQFGAKHHILRLGKSGEQKALIRYHQGAKNGLSAVRYKREQGKGDEAGWTGNAKLTCFDQNGSIIKQEVFHMECTVFLSPIPSAINKAIVEFQDGEKMEYNLY